MKKTSWEWQNSNKKRATQIMWDTQGQDLDTVCNLISEACAIDFVAARNLYRKIARDDLIAQGFVPAAAKMGRPRKDGTGTAPRINSPRAESHIVEQYEPEPEPERTETGEKESIADMKAYLEALKKRNT